MTGPARTDSAWRTIKASPQAIYRAFVDPKAFVVWLPPKGMTADIFAFDPREGGVYRMALTYQSADDATHAKGPENSDVVQGRFLSVEPGRKIVKTVEFASDDPAFQGVMTMSWMFRPVAGGTEVRIVAENVPPGVAPEDHLAGLRSTLENLAAFVE